KMRCWIFGGLYFLVLSVLQFACASHALAGNGLTISSQAIQSAANDKNASLIFGFFMGIMLTAAAYLFFIWIVMRERGQVFLLCLLISLSAYIASSSAVIMGQIGIHDDSMRDLFGTYSMVLSCIFSTCFTYYFLEVDLYNPPLRIPLYGLGGVLVVYLFYVLIDRSFGAFILPVITTLTVALILCVGIASLRQGVSGSLTHVIAFMF